jgi:hypothetical protein
MSERAAADDAFVAYRQQLGRVLEVAMEQAKDYESRRALVMAQMERWSERISAFVHELQERTPQEQVRSSSMEHER